MTLVDIKSVTAYMHRDRDACVRVLAHIRSISGAGPKT
jgi:hypothetical protein